MRPQDPSFGASSSSNTSTMTTIDSILQATNHYQVLGVDDRTADAATLRRAYLKQCVQSHPDKNPQDPRATTAFQKVALAWQVLSNDEARAVYDASMAAASSDPNSRYGHENNQNECYYAPPPEEPSFQKAMFVFCTVTSMMMGGSSAVGDVAQTLYWAEQVLQRDRDNNNNNMQHTARVAMAVGSSLRVASAAASQMGMKQSAAALDRTAAWTQMAGVAALVADVAAKGDNETLDFLKGSGGDKFEQLVKGITAVRNLLQKDAR